MIYGACQWCLVVVLAKYMDSSVVGEYALGLALTAPIIMFFNMQLRAVLATDVHERFLFGEYLGHRLAALVLALITIVIITFFYDQGVRLIIIAIAVSKVVESCGDIIYGLFQHTERMDWIAKSMIMKALSSLILFTSVVWLTRSVVLGVLSVGVSWLLVLTTYDYAKIRKYFNQRISLQSPRFNLGRLRALTTLSMPLGIASILMSVNTNVPRYIIDSYSGTSQLGVFAALSYPVIAGSMIITAIGQAVTPKLAELYSGSKIRKFRLMLIKMSLSFSIIALAGIFMTILLGKQFLEIFYTYEYAGYHLEFVVITAAGGISFYAYLLGYALTAAQCFRVQAVAFAANLIITTITAVILIPMEGILGAAYSIIIGSIGQIFIEASKLFILIQNNNSERYVREMPNKQ